MTHVNRSQLEQAAHWAARLESGTATEADRQHFEQWRGACLEHALAWAEVQGLTAELGQLSGSTRRLMRASLQGKAQQGARQRRRQGLKLLGLGAAAALTGAAAIHAGRLNHRQAVVTVAGQRQRLTLPDGTRLDVNTASRVDIEFGPLRRLLHLGEGEILVDTGDDDRRLLPPRAFWVHTPLARLQALGTRFNVRAGDSTTRLHVAAGQVALHRDGFERVVAAAGDALLVQAEAGRTGLRPLPRDGLQPQSWADGSLDVSAMALPAFLAELSRYHAGPAIRFDAPAARLTISGVFHLDGSAPVERALRALQGSLPVRVRQDADGVYRVEGR